MCPAPNVSGVSPDPQASREVTDVTLEGASVQMGAALAKDMEGNKRNGDGGIGGAAAPRTDAILGGADGIQALRTPGAAPGGGSVGFGAPRTGGAEAANSFGAVDERRPEAMNATPGQAPAGADDREKKPFLGGLELRDQLTGAVDWEARMQNEPGTDALGAQDALPSRDGAPAGSVNLDDPRFAVASGPAPFGSDAANRSENEALAAEQGGPTGPAPGAEVKEARTGLAERSGTEIDKGVEAAVPETEIDVVPPKVSPAKEAAHAARAVEAAAPAVGAAQPHHHAHAQAAAEVKKTGAEHKKTVDPTLATPMAVCHTPFDPKKAGADPMKGATDPAPMEMIASHRQQAPIQDSPSTPATPAEEPGFFAKVGNYVSGLWDDFKGIFKDKDEVTTPWDDTSHKPDTPGANWGESAGIATPGAALTPDPDPMKMLASHASAPTQDPIRLVAPPAPTPVMSTNDCHNPAAAAPAQTALLLPTGAGRPDPAQAQAAAREFLAQAAAAHPAPEPVRVAAVMPTREDLMGHD